MKYIRLYEVRRDYSKFYGIGLERGIKVGDYVLIKTNLKGYTDEYLEFLSNNYAKVISINWIRKNLKVEFPNWVEKRYYRFATFYFIQVDYWSDNLDDIQYRIDAKKYNL